MGIAWLLFNRTFKSRPKRTVLFLLGYALATAVMITLLSVGQAVLMQAQDKDLFGGGDVILVPQGIDVESMKLGGITALYYAIPQGRFIVRQLLQSSRFQNEVSVISPYLFSRLLYARKNRVVETVFAEGALPNQEKRIKGIAAPWQNNSDDDAWIHPNQSNFYHEMDHFHLPAVDSPELDRWAEWHYFNFDSNDFYGYLSLMVVGDPRTNHARWNISLQIFGDKYEHDSTTIPVSQSELPLEKVDYYAGSNHVRFHQDHYEIDLNFQDGTNIHGKLLYYPDPGLYFPPTYLAHSKDFESGYVIPAIRGKYQGSLTVGPRTYDFHQAIGYHDHNWGIWQQIQWNWGHLYSDNYSIFFGEILKEGKSKGLFACVYDRKGFVTLFRPNRISFSDYRSCPEKIQVPMQFRFQQQKPYASIDLAATAKSFVTTLVDVNNSIYFIQYKMDYTVTLEVDGQRISFPATGNAETYVTASTQTNYANPAKTRDESRPYSTR